MRLLLFSKNTSDQVFFKNISDSIKLPFIQVASVEQLCLEIQKDPQALLVIGQDYQAVENIIESKIGLFSETIKQNWIFFVHSGDFHENIWFADSKLAGSFISRSFKPENEFLIALLLKASIEEQTFGLESYFSSNTQIQTLQLFKSLEKEKIVEEMKLFLEKDGFKLRMASLIATAVDELLMNAIFDAPIDMLGKPIYAQTPRNTNLLLKDPVEIKFALEKDWFGVSVLDLFGSLNKKKVLFHMSRTYESNEFKVRTNVAGAGLGLAQVYRNSGGIIFSCEMGTRTQVTMFWKKTTSFKEFKDQFRFLSTFMYISS